LKPSSATSDGGIGSARRPLTFSFTASIAIQTINVMTGIALARILGPHGRGELAAVLLWPTLIAAIGSLGVIEATTFHAARSTTAPGTLLGSALVIALVQSAACVAVGAAILPLVLAHYDATTVRAAYLFLTFIPLNLVTLSLMAVLNGQQRFAQFHALRLLVAGGTGSAILTLRLIDNLTIENAVLVYVGATLCTGLVAAAMLVRFVPSLGFSAGLSRQLLTFGLQSHTGSVTWMMNERLDQLVISIFLAPVQLGLYVTAVTMTSLTSLVGSSVATAAFPVVARLDAADQRRDAVRRFVRLTLAVSIAVALPVAVLAPTLIGFFFKAAYLDATGVCRLLMVAAVILSTNRVLGACLKALGRPLDAGLAEFMALGVTAGGLALLLPMLGIMGAAIVSLLAYAVSTGWMLHRVGKALDVSVGSILFIDRRDVRRLIEMVWPAQRRVEQAVKAGE
jgi:O-antigen/teichoic acid export membrane protein